MRLIDADMLLEQVKAIYNAVDTSDVNISYDIGFHIATSQIQGLIDYMPTIDAVEVVRCKDCENYMTIHCTCDGCCIADDWYCADGDRREP